MTKLKDENSWKILFKIESFFDFLHITKSIHVCYDDILMKIISEQNDFILDQCAMLALKKDDTVFFISFGYEQFF